MMAPDDRPNGAGRSPSFPNSRLARLGVFSGPPVSTATAAAEGHTVRRIMLIALVLYAAHALYAVVTQRHLYGDAAWFLVKMVTEGEPTHFYTSFAHEFYYSRVVAYWLTQLPTIIALHLGVENVRALSLIFGLTYFSHRLISLWLCWRLLDDEEKPLAVFPLLGLFAGSIVSDVYIVTEIHVSTSFLWPIAILLLRRAPLSRRGEWVASAAILLAAFTYESWAFFGPLFIAAILLRRHPLRADGARVSWPVLFALVACTAVNAGAILFPRDPANKDGFVKGTLHIFSDLGRGVQAWHIGALAALAAAGITFLVLVWPRAIRADGRRTLIGIAALLLALLPIAHFLWAGQHVDLSYAVTERGFAGLVMQFILLAIFVGALTIQPPSRPGAYKALAVLVLGLAIGQVGWQLLATHAWQVSARAVRRDIRASTGPVPCETVDSFAIAGRRPSPSSIMCTWWAMPYSILQARDRHVSTMLILRDGWQPFDPYHSATLPGFQNHTIDYDAYLGALRARARLPEGVLVSFAAGQGGGTRAIVGNGFTTPDVEGVITSAKDFDLPLCLPSRGTWRVVLSVESADARGARDQQVRMAAQGQAGTTNLVASAGPRDLLVDVPVMSLDAQDCTTLHGSLADLPPSPAELGLRPDPRHLGLRFISGRVERP